MQSIAQRMIDVLLQQNAETIHRLIEQRVLLLRAYHAEHGSELAGPEAEFLRGDITGWRNTLHTLYHDSAEQIVDRVVTRTGLPFPTGDVRTTVTCAS
jgi:hypothetical protein